MSILILIQTCCFVSLATHIWFNTDFFAFYVKLLKTIIPKTIYSWMLIDEFLLRSGDDLIFSSYIDYLFTKRYFTKNFILKFLIKLLACEICLSTWLSILAGLITLCPAYIGLIFVVSKLINALLKFFLKNQL
jgi:hypothetical protein